MQVEKGTSVDGAVVEELLSGHDDLVDSQNVDGDGGGDEDPAPQSCTD
jgi:hypothetical protein